MKAGQRNRLVIGAGGAALLGAAAGAFAEAHAASAAGRAAYIEVLAARLEMTPAALRAAMLAAADDRIDAARAAGRLTPARAETLKVEIRGAPGRATLAAALARAGRQRRGRMLAHRRASERAVRPIKRHERPPSAPVAFSGAGRSADGLRAAAIATAKTRLDAAVAGGELSVREERQLLRTLARRVDTVLERNWVRGTDPRPGFGRRS